LNAESHSIEGQVADWVGQAFDAYAERCESTLLQVFNRCGSEAVEFRAWLYEVSPCGDLPARADTIHTEPLYTVGTYLGLDEEALDTPQILEKYEALESSAGWGTQAH